MYIKVEFSNCRISDSISTSLDSIFEPFCKKDYHPTVILDLREQREEVDTFKENSLLSFLDVLQTKTKRNLLCMYCSKFFRFPNVTKECMFKLCVDIKEEFRVPFCTDLDILKTHISSRVLLHTKVQNITITKNWQEKFEKFEIWLKGKCPHLKQLKFFRNCNKYFDWNNNMKTFLLNHTHAKLVYLDFTMENNQVDPTCTTEFSIQKMFRRIRYGFSNVEVESI